MIHWSQNKTHLVVYHGTHTRNIPHILKNGLSNKDPKTGMVSVTFGSHGKSVAHGYAAMSGEHNFRQAGAKAETVPDEHRSIVVAHLPMEWVKTNIDTNFGGNSPEIRSRLQNREAHEQFVAKHGTDFLPHETPEFRFKEVIPPEFIVGVEKKKTKYVTGESKEQPMKTFKEFVESIDKLSDAERALHSAFIDAGKTTIPRNSASFAIKSAMGPDHGGVTSDVMQDNMLRNINRKLGKNLSYIEDNQYEEVTTSSIPANSTAGVAKFDPLLSLAKLVRRLRTGPSNKKIPPNDINNYEHPGSAARSARTAGDGSIQGT